jgi:hypothetical protein
MAQSVFPKARTALLLVEITTPLDTLMRRLHMRR